MAFFNYFQRGIKFNFCNVGCIWTGSSLRVQSHDQLQKIPPSVDKVNVSYEEVGMKIIAKQGVNFVRKAKTKFTRRNINRHPSILPTNRQNIIWSA